MLIKRILSPESLDRWVPLRALLWAFPLAFLVHDAKEVPTAEAF